MTARDDYPTLAALEPLVSTNRTIGPEISAVFDELDALRSGRNLTGRIEGLRARARAAEELITVLARACRGGATPAQRAGACAAHTAWLTRDRVA